MPERYLKHSSERNSVQKLDRLRQFSLLGKLTDEQLIVLASRADYRAFSSGKTILELNSQDSYNYFLLEGEVLLTAPDGRQSYIEAHSARARRAIAYLQPRKFEVKALLDCRFLLVDRLTLTQVLKESPAQHTVPELAGADNASESPAFTVISAFHQDLRAQRLKLPSLPDLAMKIKAIAEKPNSHAGDLAKAIVGDPAITTKLIRAANSPLYRGFTKIDSCQDAVVRLGLDTTRQLITVFTLRELFRSDSAVLKRRMTRLWNHSLEVGSIAYVLARLSTGLSAEVAMLAGILHDIGVVLVFQYAEAAPQLHNDDELLMTVVAELREEVGCALLNAWSFPQFLIDAVRHAENYRYESGANQPTYADLVILAQVHSCIGKQEFAEIPSIEAIPAFEKLAGENLTPQRSLQVIQHSREEIKEIRRLLA